MEEIDELYSAFLHMGFIVLRQAIDSGDRQWIDAELEMLHNMPSLIGESNVERHRYYWRCERVAYVTWATNFTNQTPLSKMRMYYEPLWNQMEPIISQRL